LYPHHTLPSVNADIVSKTPSPVKKKLVLTDLFYNIIILKSSITRLVAEDFLLIESTTLVNWTNDQSHYVKKNHDLLYPLGKPLKKA